MTDQPLLSYSGLAKSYGSKRVLVDVHGSAARGNRVVILGSNGSGKTTLLKIFAGLLKSDAGQIRLDAKTWPPKSAAANAMVAWLPAIESGFWPRLSGRKSLELYARLWNVDNEHYSKVISDWSSSTSFKESLDMPTYQLSTGRRQLLHFARLVMHKPKLILADEPFRSLDEDNQAFVVEKIDKWLPNSVVIITSPNQTKVWRWHQELEIENGSLK